MSVNLGTAEGRIILDTNGFVTSLQSAQRSMGQFSADVALKIGGAFSTVGNTISTFGNTISNVLSKPLQNFAKSAFTEMASFENGLKRAAVISGTTGADLERLSEKAKEMGRTTKFSATEATEALQYMAMAGWKSDQMMDGLEGIMNLAAASGEDLASVSDIVTDALTAMGLKAKDAGHFADVLTVATLNTNTTVGMLGEAFKYVAPVAGTLNYKIEDVTLALGIMANAGIKATQAGTSLRSALVRMTIAPGQVGKAMEELGIEMFDAKGKALPLVDLLDQLRDVFDGLTDKQAAYYAGVIFGRNAMSAMLSIIKADEDEYERLIDVLSKVDGKARETAMQMQQTFEGQWIILQSAISGFILQFEKDVLPVLTEFVKKLQEVFARFSNLDDGARKVVLALVAFGVAIGPIIAGFGTLLATIGAAITSLGMIALSFEALAAVSGAAIATATGWGAAIVAAIAAATGVVIAFTAAFVDLMANDDAFYGQFMAEFTDIKAMLRGLYDEFRKVLDDLGLKNVEFTDLLLMAWEYVKNAIGPVIIWMVDQVKVVIRTISLYIEGFLEVFDGFIKLFQGNFREGMTQILTGLAQMITSFFIGMFDSVVATIKEILGIVDSLGISTENNAKRVSNAVAAANSDVKKTFTDFALNHENFKEATAKVNGEVVKEHKDTGKKVIEAIMQQSEGMQKAYDEADKDVAEAAKKMGSDYVTNFGAEAQNLPKVVGDQRYPTKIEADKIGSDLIAAGEATGSGYVGVIDAALSWLPAKVKTHLDLTLDYADDFADEFTEIGSSAGADFADTIARKITDLSTTLEAKFKAILTSAQNFGDNFTKNVNDKIGALPAKVQTSLNAVLTNTNAWKTNMVNAASAMATQFNTNAGSMAADLSTKLNRNLNASLDVANGWVDKMAKKGAEGAKLFLTAMTDAVDSQGKEIETFGSVIAERVIAGLRGRMKWFKDELKGMFRDAIDQIEEDLGITDSVTNSLSTNAAAKMGYASDYGIGAGTITTGTQATAQKTTATTASNTAGTTINFYSPTAINEIEASRLLRQTQREMALGF